MDAEEIQMWADAERSGLAYPVRIKILWTGEHIHLLSPYWPPLVNICVPNGSWEKLTSKTWKIEITKIATVIGKLFDNGLMQTLTSTLMVTGDNLEGKVDDLEIVDKFASRGGKRFNRVLIALYCFPNVSLSRLDGAYTTYIRPRATLTGLKGIQLTPTGTNIIEHGIPVYGDGFTNFLNHVPAIYHSKLYAEDGVPRPVSTQYVPRNTQLRVNPVVNPNQLGQMIHQEASDVATGNYGGQSVVFIPNGDIVRKVRR